MAKTKKDGYPEQGQVREMLEAYISQFDGYEAAANKIGVDRNRLHKWRRGAEPIPVWFCEHLGFRKQRVNTWVPIGGPVGVRPA